MVPELLIDNVSTDFNDDFERIANSASSQMLLRAGAPSRTLCKAKLVHRPDSTPACYNTALMLTAIGRLRNAPVIVPA